MKPLDQIKKEIFEEFIEQQLFESTTDGSTEYYFNDECTLILYRDLEEKTGLARPYLKPIVLELRNEGLIELSVAVDYEYNAPNGSGYMLTKKGVDYVNEHYPFKPE
jgi:hypothetical protein